MQFYIGISKLNITVQLHIVGLCLNEKDDI